jgi:hypothetical protein
MSALRSRLKLPHADSPSENSRLADQHRFITSGLGFTIHPIIEKGLSLQAYTRPNKIKIADISRGDQFMDGAALPPSLNLAQRIHIPWGGSIGNDKTNDEFRGQFDIVAVRLLHTNLQADRWASVLKDLVALLRPGGYLQWIDFDPMTARIATVKPGASDSVLRGILNHFTDALRAQKAGSTYRISTAMRQHLINDESDMFTVAPDVQFTRTVVASALLYLERSGNLTGEEASELRARVKEEIDAADSLIYYDLWCHIGKKPE